MGKNILLINSGAGSLSWLQINQIIQGQWLAIFFLLMEGKQLYQFQLLVLLEFSPTRVDNNLKCSTRLYIEDFLAFLSYN